MERKSEMMEKNHSSRSRQRLQKAIMSAFRQEMQTLTPEMQYILTDDLLTAFQNRITVFQRIQAGTSPQLQNQNNCSLNS